MLAREGGVRCPVVGLRKARTAANCGWSSRCANSDMAAAPCAPASFAAAETAKTLASEWRTPRAERNSGTPRRQSNRLRSRPADGTSGCPRPQPHDAGSSSPPSASRAPRTSGCTNIAFGCPCSTQPPPDRAKPLV